jgi:hypothetical protein
MNGVHFMPGMKREVLPIQGIRRYLWQPGCYISLFFGVLTALPYFLSPCDGIVIA